MNTKKLLLLVLTMLLPLVSQNITASNTFATMQGYGDTDSLLSDTSQELVQAYNLLDMLKKRSEELASQDVDFNKKESTQSLPRNIDHIRNRCIKQQLLDVLSATPFSNPEKHIKDCKTAISALEGYVTEIQKSSQPPTTQAAITAACAPINVNLAAEYDISTNTTPLPAPKVAPTFATEMRSFKAPVELQTITSQQIIPTIIPAAISTRPYAATAPLSTTLPISQAAVATKETKLAMPALTAPVPTTSATTLAVAPTQNVTPTIDASTATTPVATIITAPSSLQTINHEATAQIEHAMPAPLPVPHVDSTPTTQAAPIMPSALPIPVAK